MASSTAVEAAPVIVASSVCDFPSGVEPLSGFAPSSGIAVASGSVCSSVFAALSGLVP